jgi:hypothetical protein
MKGRKMQVILAWLHGYLLYFGMIACLVLVAAILRWFHE